MARSAALTERVRLAQELRAGRAAVSDDDEDLVQLAVRLPAPLRAQVHRAAAASGCPSTQAWLHDVIAGAVANELDPQRRAARRVHEVLIDRLTEQVDAGHYEAVVAELGLEDPELA